MGRVKSLGFNPCKGFGGFGTGSLGNIPGNSRVSIPVRVLGVLERFTYLPVSIFLFVSIPVRVLGVLEHNLSTRGSVNGMFQSL